MAAESVRIEAVVKVLTYVICMLSFAMVARPAGLVYTLIFLAMAALSVVFERQARFVVPRWVLNLMALVILVMSLFRISLADPVTPVLQMLLLMVGIKLLEQKGFRDYMQIYLLSVFLLAGSALVSIDMDFLAALIALMYLLSTAIVLLTYYVQDARLEVSRPVVRRMLATSLLIPTIALPLSLLFFIVMPRSTFPLMTFLNRGSGGSSGFSEQVSLGDVAGIQENTLFAFRAEMQRIDDDALYWRGIVLDTFDGQKWTRSADRSGAAEYQSARGPVVQQVIYLEPYQNRYLFALDRPMSVSLRQAQMASDLTITLPRVFERRIRYEAVSAPMAQTASREAISPKYTRLPERQWSEVRALVRSVTGRARGAEAAAAIAAHLRDSGRYTYALQSLPQGGDPVQTFLFEVRRGNCEYFASSMAVMLRMIDIPARLVGGYRGGYYNEVAGYYAVPQKSAHVWVEAHIDGQGWVRFDPTPPSAETYSAAVERSFALKMRMLMDSVQYAWNAFVISYDFEKQMRLFQTMRDSARNMDTRLSLSKNDLAVFGAVLVSCALAAALVWYLKHRPGPEQRLLGEFLSCLARSGYARRDGEGLSELVSRISQTELRDEAGSFVERYHRCYYRDGAFDAESLRGLGQILQKIKQIQTDT